jgi:hypothetical protein
MTYKYQPRISGIGQPLELFSKDTINKIICRLPLLRMKFRSDNFDMINPSNTENNPDKELAFSGRFSNDNYIIASIQSNTKENEFLKNADEWLTAAMENAASAEYSYKKE